MLTRTPAGECRRSERAARVWRGRIGYYPKVGIDPGLALLAAVTTAIGWTMLFAGARKRMLDLRHQKRTCPSCGHEIDGRVCNRH